MNRTNAVQTFHFDSLDVRTVEGVDGDPWFVAKDVCGVLEIVNTSQAVDSLDEDERSMFNIGRQGDVNIISEPGLYALVGRSRKPEAKRFDRWVRHEVLPSLRKHGSYSMNGESDPLLAQIVAINNQMSAAIANLSELAVNHDQKIDKLGEKVDSAVADILDIKTRLPRTRKPSKTDMRWVKDMAGILGGRDPLRQDRSLFDGAGNFIGEIDHVDDNPHNNQRSNLWPLHPDTHAQKRTFSRAEINAASNHWHNQAKRAEPYNYPLDLPCRA